MIALLSPRLWLALAIAVFLAGTHFSAYRSGKHQVRLQWDASIAQQTAAALAASEASRAREQALQSTARKVANDYQAEKTRRVAADARAADSLQRLDAALAGAAGPAGADPATPARADDDPRDDIIAQCAGALVRVDSAYRSLADQTRALQQYTAGVCVTQ